MFGKKIWYQYQTQVLATLYYKRVTFQTRFVMALKPKNGLSNKQ